YSAEIEVAGPTMIHDFAITDTDAIFWELPVVFDLDLAIAAVSGDGEGQMPFLWDPSYGARVGIMPLEGPTSAIRWVEIDPCYSFHGVNAHRDGDDVVLDLCVMPTMFQEGGDLGTSLPHRWTIGTGGDALSFTDEALTAAGMDLPAIDRRFAGRPSNQAWYLRTEPDGDYEIEFSGLWRRDEQSGAFDTYAPGPGERVNEAVFVPVDEGEGEGWLLTYAWDRARDAT